MWIHYPDLIRESDSELAALERQRRRHPTADRIKMLRLLKSDTFRSRRALAPVLGYSQRQLQRWWDAYQAGGMEALLVYESCGGSQERITPEAWATLMEEMKAGRIATLKQIQSYLHQQWGIDYRVGSISRLLQRHKVKLKTGRRRHRQASAEEQGAFKKKGSLTR